METRIYISIEKYCTLKNISKTTYFHLKNNNKIPYKIIKKSNNYRKYYLVINSKDIITIKSDKNGIIV